jgi:hypothetical protein
LGRPFSPDNANACQVGLPARESGGYQVVTPGAAKSEYAFSVLPDGLFYMVFQFEPFVARDDRVNTIEAQYINWHILFIKQFIFKRLYYCF